MFESGISATEKLPCSENLSISSWSSDIEGHAKKYVEPYCELASKTTQYLYKLSTPCIDDHHFKEEELKSVGDMSKVCSQIVQKCLYLARIGRPDILWSVNKLARAITKWTKACDKRLKRLISYIHHTGWFGGPLTWRSAHAVAGPAAPGPHPLAHRCGDCWWCHDEVHCAQHHRPWGVEFRRPRQAADPLGVLSCRRALSPAVRILCLARFQHVRMRPPVLGSSFFLHLFAVDSLGVLNPRNSSVSKKTCEYKQYCHVGNTAKQCRLGLFQDSDFAGDLEDSKSTSGGTLCVFGSHTFVPISWMCKKQTAVSHSSTESEIISLDTGLRLDGLPALELWDLIVSVLGHVSRVSDRSGQPDSDVHKRHKSHNKIDVMKDIDAVPSNVHSVRQEALLYVFEDKDCDQDDH